MVPYGIYSDLFVWYIGFQFSTQNEIHYPSYQKCDVRLQSPCFRLVSNCSYPSVYFLPCPIGPVSDSFNLLCQFYSVRNWDSLYSFHNTCALVYVETLNVHSCSLQRRWRLCGWLKSWFSSYRKALVHPSSGKVSNYLEDTLSGNADGLSDYHIAYLCARILN